MATSGRLSASLVAPILSHRPRTVVRVDVGDPITSSGSFAHLWHSSALFSYTAAHHLPICRLGDVDRRVETGHDAELSKLSIHDFVRRSSVGRLEGRVDGLSSGLQLSVLLDFPSLIGPHVWLLPCLNFLICSFCKAVRLTVVEGRKKSIAGGCGEYLNGLILAFSPFHVSLGTST